MYLQIYIDINIFYRCMWGGKSLPIAVVIVVNGSKTYFSNIKEMYNFLERSRIVC